MSGWTQNVALARIAFSEQDGKAYLFPGSWIAHFCICRYRKFRQQDRAIEIIEEEKKPRDGLFLSDAFLSKEDVFRWFFSPLKFSLAPEWDFRLDSLQQYGLGNVNFLIMILFIVFFNLLYVLSAFPCFLVYSIQWWNLCVTENTQFSNGKVTVAQYRPVEIPQTQAAGTGLESIMLRIETQGAESLAESDQRQRELHINQELFSCASCGAGSKGHAGRADANADLRLFSCLHSVCRRCLASSCIRDDGTAVCPSCLEPTQLPEIGWVEALPRNYWSQARGEANAEHTEPAELECGECAEGEAVESIAGACLDCSELLCSVHWLAHQKGRRTKGHRMTTDVGAVLRTPSGSNAVCKTIGVPCSVHSDYDVVGFCNSCQQMVCKICLERSHRSHSIDRDFQPAILFAKKRAAKKIMETSESGIQKCEASITQLNARVDAVNQAAAEASKEITTSVERLIKTLRREEQRALLRTDETRWSLQKEMEQRLGQKKSAKSQLQRARFLTQASLKGEINNAQFLHVCDMLRGNAERANSECSSKVDLGGLHSLRVIPWGRSEVRWGSSIIWWEVARQVVNGCTLKEKQLIGLGIWVASPENRPKLAAIILR